MPGVGDGYRALAAAPGMPVSEINYTWMMDARNKRSLTLNLKDPRGKAILLRLVADCDVYVTNQPMPMRRALGLTYDDLKQINPTIDLCVADRLRRRRTGARPRRIRPRRVLGAHRAHGSRSNGRRRTRAIAAWHGRSSDRGRAVRSDRHCAVSTRKNRYRQRGAHVTARKRTLGGRMCRASQTDGRGLFGMAQFRTHRNDASALSRARRSLAAVHDGPNTHRDRRTSASCVGLGDTARQISASRRPKRVSKTVWNWSSGCAIASRFESSQEWLASFREAKVPAALMGTLDDLVSDPQLTAQSNDGYDGRLRSSDATRHQPSGQRYAVLPRRSVHPAPDLGATLRRDALRSLGIGAAEIAELRSRRRHLSARVRAVEQPTVTVDDNVRHDYGDRLLSFALPTQTYDLTTS